MMNKNHRSNDFCHPLVRLLGFGIQVRCGCELRLHDSAISILIKRLQRALEVFREGGEREAIVVTL